MPNEDVRARYRSELRRIQARIDEMSFLADNGFVLPDERPRFRAEVNRVVGRLGEIQAAIEGIVDDRTWDLFVKGHREAARGIFSEEEVLAALRLAMARHEPASSVPAGAVAAALYGGPVTHTDRIRTGLDLSRLARRGLVRKVPPKRIGHDTNRWAAA